MCKSDIEFNSKCHQYSIGRIQQGVCGKIIHRSEPFALEDSPQCLCDIQLKTIRRKEEKELSSFLPYRTKFLHEFTHVYACIVKHHKCILADTHRHSVKKVCDFLSRHVLRCGEVIIAVVSVKLQNINTYKYQQDEKDLFI